MTEEAEEEAAVDLYLTVHGAGVRGVVNLVRVGVSLASLLFKIIYFTQFSCCSTEIDMGKNAPSHQF